MPVPRSVSTSLIWSLIPMFRLCSITNGLLVGACFSLFAAPLLAQGPPGPEAARAAMAKISKMVGKWEGEATVQMGPGPAHKVRQTENVQSKLDGSVLLVEGIGHQKGDDGKEKVVFQALAVCAYDANSKSYKFHAFRDNGMATVANAEVTDTGMIWGFEDGRGGKIRYTITLKDDTWSEIGEYLMEGQPARKFFEMTVKRVTESTK
jgi:hypothetical protein